MEMLWKRAKFGASNYPTRTDKSYSTAMFTTQIDFDVKGNVWACQFGWFFIWSPRPIKWNFEALNAKSSKKSVISSE